MGGRGYAGTLRAWALVRGGWIIEVVEKPTDVTAFTVVAKRWILERTFAWLGRCRRLSKDDEALPETSAARIRVAMIQRMLTRLTL